MLVTRPDGRLGSGLKAACSHGSHNQRTRPGTSATPVLHGATAAASPPPMKTASHTSNPSRRTLPCDYWLRSSVAQRRHWLDRRQCDRSCRSFSANSLPWQRGAATLRPQSPRLCHPTAVGGRGPCFHFSSIPAMTIYGQAYGSPLLDRWAREPVVADVRVIMRDPAFFLRIVGA